MYDVRFDYTYIFPIASQLHLTTNYFFPTDFSSTFVYISNSHIHTLFSGSIFYPIVYF